MVGSWYTICSWSPLACWLLQCLLENFWGSLWFICSCSAGFLYDTYIHMPFTVGTGSVIVNSNWNVQLWEFYIGKQITDDNNRFHFRHGKNLQKTFTDWRKLDRICGKWGYSQENSGTTCTGVGASFPQNVTKVLDFHLHRTTVIHKVCNAICEPRLNFMN